MMGMLGSPLPESALSPRKAIDEPPVENDPDALVGWLSDRTKATLELKDGTIFDGYSFGHHESIAGEVVFNTGMVGYPESLTDPSYAGQILVITFPLVGNYGVPAEERDEHGLMKGFESDKIHVKAVIVADYSFVTSHYTARRTLSEWLKQHKIPGIYGVDTRAITKQIRKHGAILGKVHIEGCTKEIEWEDPNLRNLAGEVSRKAPQVFEPPPLPEGTQPGRGGTDSEMLGEGDKTIHIMAVDCGMKNNIIRYMVNSLRVKLTVVPWDYNFVDEKFDGLFLSNGPGDPKQCQETIKNVQTLMEKRPMCPIFGICLGNQILALAAGATTYKMKFGNRGMNQPCVDLRTTRCYITPQNHGFAVDTNSLSGEWMPLMVNANDGSNEGIVHRLRPWFSVQFHPEACGGPTDTAFLFWHFLRNVAKPTMPSITTIPYSMPASFRKVLLLGSGGLTIGQAGEFDYSGSQALKALRESGIHTIVLNPNIATVQTSAGMADRIYFLPVTVEFVTEVIKRERPDGILCTFGGQTALNCGVKLNERGILQKYGVQVLGTPIQAIITTEDRELFAKAVVDCGYKVAESECCTTTEQAVAAAESIGYPVLVRAAFALGGLGSGFAQDVNQLHKLLKQAFVNSSQVIIDKSLKGWKELEYEVVRDGNDNCITVCNMENLDPMGIHTGDSIVIAPSQTLTNAEYYRLRECALKVVRHLGVVGECNIQYAVDPQSHEFRIIEVNARLSRSSALASKATGYPLAYVAAKLALGHDLVTLRNSVTKCTTACFEPSLDYVVAKIPRWDLRKFSTVDPAVGSAMKSVGEVMSIGRTFEETIQKALRMVDDSSVGFDADRFDQELSTRGVTAADAIADSVKAELTRPSPMRIWAVAKAFEMGMRVEDIHELTKIDRWFLSKLFHIHQVKTALQNYDIGDLANEIPLLQEAKRCGFADKQIANQLKVREAVSPTTIVSKFSKYSPVIKPAVSPDVPTELQANEACVRYIRKLAGVKPFVKQIDTLAAEFPAETNYLYLTYNGIEHDIDLGNPDAALPDPFTHQTQGLTIPDPIALSYSGGYPTQSLVGLDQKDGGEPRSRVIVLGCGPYRIGSSVEFDWCCVNCIKTLRSLGHEVGVINCNPETVSTDFDESNRLYFEELSQEVVLAIAEMENPGGVVVSVGGQTPNNLAMGLHKNGVKILGTSVEAIDACENRFRFSQLCDALRIDQPEWSEFTTIDEALHFVKRVGYPVLVRPSYVLSGAAMRVVTDNAELERFLRTAAIVSRDYPVVISNYIAGAKEVELDAVGCNGNLLNYAIAEHVENAGVHSGDATLLLPAQKLFVETHRRVKQIGQKICRALKISGPFNIQFICKENEVKVIECNLRASRSMPYISKTYNVNFIELATRVMLGQQIAPAVIQPIDMDHIAVKVPVFSFDRLLNSDPRLGVEMQSTGEVACFGVNQYEAFLKGMIAKGFRLPTKNILVCIGPQQQKIEFLPYVEKLVDMGFQIYATKNTHDVLLRHGLEKAILVYKPLVKREPNTATMLSSGKLDLVINVPDSMDSQALTDGFALRRTSVDCGVPLIVDIKTAILTVMALHRKWSRETSGRAFFSFSSWQEYVQPPEVPATA